MNRCRWCRTVMDIVSSGVAPTLFRCPTCGAETGNGIVTTPDPDALREYADELAALADELESDSPLASRLRE